VSRSNVLEMRIIFSLSSILLNITSAFSNLLGYSCILSAFSFASFLNWFSFESFY
jgi:hypothetical protein